MSATPSAQAPSHSREHQRTSKQSRATHLKLLSTAVSDLFALGRQLQLIDGCQEIEGFIRACKQRPGLLAILDSAEPKDIDRVLGRVHKRGGK